MFKTALDVIRILQVNPLIAGAEYIGFSLNYYHIQYRLLSMLMP